MIDLLIPAELSWLRSRGKKANWKPNVPNNTKTVCPLPGPRPSLFAVSRLESIGQAMTIPAAI